jgi:hypothetical protein
MRFNRLFLIHIYIYNQSGSWHGNTPASAPNRAFGAARLLWGPPLCVAQLPLPGQGAPSSLSTVCGAAASPRPKGAPPNMHHLLLFLGGLVVEEGLVRMLVRTGARPSPAVAS